MRPLPVLLVPSIGLLLCLLLLQNCQTNENKAAKQPTDPLPSWNEGPRKQALLQFVQETTDASNPQYIAIPDRIAVFDNDGNLWAEKPVYFQLFFAMDRVKSMASEHPEWKEQQPFKAVLENDMSTLMEQGEHGLLTLVMSTHAGTTTEEFEKIVSEWLRTAQHPQLNRPYTDLVYQPMLELLTFLRANDFKTFIVSGGGIEFMRPWVEEVYGIPKDQVIGSSIKTEFTIENGIPTIKRLPAIDFIDDKAGKPVGIQKFIGRRPVFCSGNSDGDLAMMQWTAAGKGPKMMLYLHHTDEAREWAYDRNSAVGRLDKGLDIATNNGWQVIDMKKDWKTVFPF